MTVVFAFVSPNHQASFMGADDLEGLSRKSQDKVGRGLDRFLFAVTGVDSLMVAAHCVGIMGREETVLRNFSPYQPPNSIESFCELVAKILPRVVRRAEESTKRAIAARERTHDEAAEVRKLGAHLVLIDLETHRLACAEFPRLFPARAKYVYRLDEFPQEQVVRFGVNVPLVVGPVTNVITSQPFEWCADRVAEAKAEVESHGFKDYIGDLGSCYIAEHNGAVKFRSSYTSFMDLLGEHFP
jgi:hypothetical protein